jgi:hypothetical protein
MLGAKRFDRFATGLAMPVAVLTGSTCGAWAQGPRSVGPTSPSPGASGSTASTVLTVVFLTAIVIAVVIVARYVVTRRKRLEEALILQAQLSDAILRENPLHGLVITPKAHVPWRGSPVTIEVVGEVPTSELRETVMRLVRAEVSRRRLDVLTEDHLFIVPPMHRAS